jgi:rhodanese-related sulfurtransferase
MGDKGDAYKTINITDAKNIINAVLLDIRDRDSYLQEHIPNAIHLTQDNIEDFKKKYRTR